MNIIFADTIVYDNIGISYTGNTFLNTGMGASESQVILLLEELAKLNKKVICLNNTSNNEEINNVLYLSNTYTNSYKFKCNNLILHRNSLFPKNIEYKKCFQWVTDNNTFLNLNYYNILEQNKCELITLSKYSNDQFPKNWNKHIINFIVPDWVYDFEISKSKKDFVYASSIMKGYIETFNYWKYLKLNSNLLSNKRLKVCLPGYDNPQSDISNYNLQIDYLGSLPFKNVVELLASAEGLFFVNTMQETFCLTAVLAEILKANPYILCLNGYGALNETLNSKTVTNNTKDFFMNIEKKTQSLEPKNYKAKKIMPQWLTIFNN
jgi:hypothetical protein